MSVKVVIVSVSFKAFWVFGFIFIGILNEKMENLDYYVLFKESLYLITQVWTYISENKWVLLGLVVLKMGLLFFIVCWKMGLFVLTGMVILGLVGRVLMFTWHGSNADFNSDFSVFYCF